MRIPAFIFEHPVESLIAGALLLALLFAPADHRGVGTASSHSGTHQVAVAKSL